MRTLYDPENNVLFAGAKETLAWCKEHGYELILVSRKEGQREKQMQELGINDYFSNIILTKDKRHEIHTIAQEHMKTHLYVVGDRVREEITAGNAVGATTIWFKLGKFAQELPESKEQEPTHCISSYTELVKILP